LSPLERVLTLPILLLAGCLAVVVIVAPNFARLNYHCFEEPAASAEPVTAELPELPLAAPDNILILFLEIIN